MTRKMVRSVDQECLNKAGSDTRIYSSRLSYFGERSRTNGLQSQDVTDMVFVPQRNQRVANGLLQADVPCLQPILDPDE